MRSLLRRVQALEAKGGNDGWSAYFHTLSDADLLRLEGIIEGLPPPQPQDAYFAALEALSNADAAFLESVCRKEPIREG